MNLVSTAIVSVISTACPWYKYRLVEEMLDCLTRLENHYWWLSEMAYGWSTTIWENRQNSDGWERLLLLSLQVGFRHTDSQNLRVIDIRDPTRTECHQEVVDTVFKSGNIEAIADIACAS